MLDFLIVVSLESLNFPLSANSIKEIREIAVRHITDQLGQQNALRDELFATVLNKEVQFIESGFHRSLLYHMRREMQQILLILFLFLILYGVTTFILL